MWNTRAKSQLQNNQIQKHGQNHNFLCLQLWFCPCFLIWLFLIVICPYISHRQVPLPEQAQTCSFLKRRLEITIALPSSDTNTIASFYFYIQRVFLGLYPFYLFFMIFGCALFALYYDNHAGIPLCKVEPFLDVTNIYYYLKGHDRQKKLPKETKSLATICEELLGILLSKVSVDKMSYLHFLEP